jgi:hypothetical protein
MVSFPCEPHKNITVFKGQGQPLEVFRQMNQNILLTFLVDQNDYKEYG